MVVCYGSQTYWYSTLRTKKPIWTTVHRLRRHEATTWQNSPCAWEIPLGIQFTSFSYKSLLPLLSVHFTVPPHSALEAQEEESFGVIHCSHTHTTDKRSECSHHLRSSQTTSPCLSVFHLDFLLGIQVPTRPRYPVRSRRDFAPSSLARIPKSSQISPPPLSLHGLSNCSGRSADTVYRRFMLACLLASFSS